jgi:hypothetical protein
MKESLIAHHVDTHDLAHDDGVSVGGCCTHDCNQGRECPIQYAGPEPEEYDDPRGGMVVAAMAVFSVALVFFAFVIALIITS